MKFTEMQYKRPDMKELVVGFTQLLTEFNTCASFDDANSIMVKINDLRGDLESMAELVGIRHTIDTTDAFYEGEQDFIDENMPIYQGLVAKYYGALINSKFRPELEEKWGKQLFNMAALNIKTFSPEIIEDLQMENKLSSEYTKLIASAKIMFEGEERTLSQLTPFRLSTDRDMRKRANEAKYDFFSENETKLDEIYDGLVKVRTKIAKKLGYENFVQLGYDRMLRSDYNAEMVANYRKQVEEVIVPMATKLRERQCKRLDLAHLYYYDEGISFKSGNAKPHGNPGWIVNNGKKMYEELSKETGEFFNFMINNELMNLESKKGKAGGGYCTFIGKYKSPFIFSNFNGTSGDVDVLTHEAGHAFQAYCSRNYAVPEYNFPTNEAAEIHSMSMEFLTWPWMNLFFEEEELKYKFNHLSEALLFLPYGVTVDEFQHFVYNNPEASPTERKLAWREIEKKYLPHRDYAGNDYLERGGFWYQQGHIFGSPFYYIDYTLAQVCAFQFFKKANDNRENAMADYMNLCAAGGSKSFLGLVELANLKSPFDDGCIKSVINDIKIWLDSVDDIKL
ncbi:M3 family oligoendopeptidase [Clostridium tagluense]|uniref:M3 family oligoendopeptidase n=1 Tax=Clostridium tagluense TaxID=360422 RepID=UPI001CF52D10|nr:M3 family oligoendopeptidase [Clostridium tagluense]MCB2310744.1 M3 family oligoendopeptidase [Clostridium tagluense]MCB2315526.1 M3 family oligoendopeptidase [Clostridium tagluense]MCB2320380.1 M3 family oligoendopeptidase [Clostridium tagluense]MCB2325337.1 M3 family oligoendopeptidase [Clostridium tagluense]MCB2330189.1 M3 family oligoendopeptidase [Clostridium tagluense]